MEIEGHAMVAAHAIPPIDVGGEIACDSVDHNIQARLNVKRLRRRWTPKLRPPGRFWPAWGALNSRGVDDEAFGFLM